MVFTGFKLLFRDQISVITSSNYICVSSRETNREYVFSTHIGGTNVVLMTNKRDDQGIFYYRVSFYLVAFLQNVLFRLSVGCLITTILDSDISFYQVSGSAQFIDKLICKLITHLEFIQAFPHKKYWWQFKNCSHYLISVM